MIFGFGKEKVDYTHGALFCLGNIWSTKLILEKVWNESSIEQLPNYEENEKKIVMAISRLMRALISVTPSIADDQAGDLNRFISMYRYFGIYEIPGSDLNVKDNFSTFKEYIEEDERVEKAIEKRMGMNNPVLSFLYGLMDILEVEKSLQDESVNKLMEVQVNLDVDASIDDKGSLLDWIQGVAANNNQYFQKNKFRVSEQDQDMFHAVIDEGSYVDFIR